METFLTVLIVVLFLVAAYFIGKTVGPPEDFMDRVMVTFFGSIILLGLGMIAGLIYLCSAEITKWILY